MSVREPTGPGEEMVTGHIPDEALVSDTDRGFSPSRSESPEGRQDPYAEDAANEDAETSDESDPSLDDMITNAQWVLYQKQQELIALADLTAAEVNVARQSVVVTGISILASFVFACFCWLIANIGIAITLHHFNVHNGITALIVFVLNLALAVAAFAIARNAYRYISLMPAVRTLLQAVGVNKEEKQEETKS